MPLTEDELQNLMRRVVIRPDEAIDRKFAEIVASAGAPENLVSDLPETLRKKVSVVLEMMNVDPVGFAVGGLWGKTESSASDEQFLRDLGVAKGLREHYRDFITFEDVLLNAVRQDIQ